MVSAGSAHLRMEAESSPVNFLYAAAILLAMEVQKGALVPMGCGHGDEARRQSANASDKTRWLASFELVMDGRTDRAENDRERLALDCIRNWIYHPRRGVHAASERISRGCCC